MQMINTDQCGKCIHAEINKENKAKVLIHCLARDKTYIWGQCIPCEDFKKIPKETEE